MSLLASIVVALPAALGAVQAQEPAPTPEPAPEGLVIPGINAPPGQARPRASEAGSEDARRACPLPVYLRGGGVRCADEPLSTAFGRVVWVEAGRAVSLPASRVDLERTLPVHEQAPRRRRGGFSLTEHAEGPASAAASNPEGSWPDAYLSPPEPDRGRGSSRGERRERGLSLEERRALQDQMQEARSELDVLVKRYRALALTGAGPSNALSSAIIQREKRIESIQRQLDR